MGLELNLLTAAALGGGVLGFIISNMEGRIKQEDHIMSACAYSGAVTSGCLVGLWSGVFFKKYLL